MRFPAPRAASDERSDADLLASVRAGDDQAFDVLYRRHRLVAYAAANRAVGAGGAHDVDDVVSESFARVLRALRAGNGPSTDLRPYLLATVNNAWVDMVRRGTRTVTVDPADLTPLLSHGDGSGRQAEGEVLVNAMAGLAPRWQYVLWLTEVDGLSHEEVGELLRLSANAVAALAFRARRGLRDAYLTQHVATPSSPACTTVRPHLAPYADGRATPLGVSLVEAHLPECDDCRRALADLRAVTPAFGALLLPLLAAPQFLGGLHLTGAAAAAGAGGAGSTSGGSGASVATGLATAGAKALVALAVLATVGSAGWYASTHADALFATDAGVAAATPGHRGNAREAGSPAANSERAVVSPPGASSSPTSDPSSAPRRPTAAPVTSSPAPSVAPASASASSSASSSAGTQPSHSSGTTSGLVVPRPTPSPSAILAPPVPTGGASAPSTPADPDPTTGTPLAPAVGTLSVAASPLGALWRRVTIAVDNASDDTRVTVTGTGAGVYCARGAGCTVVVPPTTWTVQLTPSDGDLVVDVLATRTATISASLADITRSVVVS